MSSPDIQRYPHPIISKEGWGFVALSVSLAVVVTGLGADLAAIPLWVIAVFIIQFFRDPPRAGPSDPHAIASPADGRIVYVGPERDPVTNEISLKISVFMNIFNVHSNRAPIAGQVKHVQYFPGRFLNAAIDKASLKNERNIIVLADALDRRLTCVQVAGLIARRILCYVEEGDQLGRGARYGFIRFGSRVDLFLPEGSRSEVAVGDKVFAHRSVLAQWPESGPKN